MQKCRVKRNNYAISSQNIVRSMQKSVGASQTFGVSMQELIGYTTAIFISRLYEKLYSNKVGEPRSLGCALMSANRENPNVKSRTILCQAYRNIRRCNDHPIWEYILREIRSLEVPTILTLRRG